MIPAMRAVGHDVVGVMSSSESRAQQYAKENELELATDSLEQALGWDADAVYISTTNQLHAAQAIAAFEAGRHVLCEKPLAMTIADAEAVVASGASHGRVLATNHHIRNSRVIQVIRGLIYTGQIGELVALRVHHAVSLPERLRGWRLTDAAAGAGVILDITVHNADTVRFITGREVESVTAVATSSGMGGGTAEDTAMCVLSLEGGALAMTHESFVVPHAGTALEVHGSEASIFASNVLTQDPVGEILVRTATMTVEVPVPERPDLYQVGLRAFEDAVTNGTDLACTGADGVASLAVALAARTSATEHRAVPISEILSGGAP
jgi:1,5-anhydro-D-fructose reductase (1,5-anhydro-D-mannitol-forming)